MGIPIKCVETGVEYKSMGEAARKTGISIEAIVNAIHGITKTGGGCHWERLDGVPIPNKMMREEGRIKPIRIRVRETGRVYESMKQAERETGWSRDSMWQAMTSEQRTVDGYHLERID